MTSTVTLKTKGGWQHTTTLNDSIFSDILAPYLELGEEVSEVLLEGSVGEVIEREWPMWEKMEVAIRGDKAPINTGKLTPSFLQFATILNLPCEWKVFVSLNREWMSGEERLRHYREVREILYASKAAYPVPERFTMRTINLLFPLLKDGELVQLLEGMWWESLVRGDSMVALLTVDWEPFLARVKSKCVEDPLIINTIELLLGRGDLRRADLFVGMEVVCESRLNVHAKAMYGALVRNIDPRDGWTLPELHLCGLCLRDGRNSSGLLLIHRVHEALMIQVRSTTLYGRASEAAHIFFDQLDRESAVIILRLIEANVLSLDTYEYEHFSTFSQRLNHLLQHEEE